MPLNLLRRSVLSGDETSFEADVHRTRAPTRPRSCGQGHESPVRGEDVWARICGDNVDYSHFGSSRALLRSDVYLSPTLLHTTNVSLLSNIIHPSRGLNRQACTHSRPCVLMPLISVTHLRCVAVTHRAAEEGLKHAHDSRMPRSRHGQLARCVCIRGCAQNHEAASSNRVWVQAAQ